MRKLIAIRLGRENRFPYSIRPSLRLWSVGLAVTSDRLALASSAVSVEDRSKSYDRPSKEQHKFA